MLSQKRSACHLHATHKQTSQPCNILAHILFKDYKTQVRQSHVAVGHPASKQSVQCESLQLRTSIWQISVFQRLKQWSTTRGILRVHNSADVFQPLRTLLTSLRTEQFLQESEKRGHWSHVALLLKSEKLTGMFVLFLLPNISTDDSYVLSACCSPRDYTCAVPAGLGLVSTGCM